MKVKKQFKTFQELEVGDIVESHKSYYKSDNIYVIVKIRRFWCGCKIKKVKRFNYHSGHFDWIYSWEVEDKREVITLTKTWKK